MFFNVFIGIKKKKDIAIVSVGEEERDRETERKTECNE